MPAVGVVDVEVAVVFEVQETASPAPAAVGDAGLVGHIDKRPVVVPVQAIADPRYVRRHIVADGANAAHEPVEIAVAVVVADRRTHAVAVDDHLVVGDVAERGVGVVDEHLGGVEVRDHEDVGVHVVVDAREGRRERVVEVQLRHQRILVDDNRRDQAACHADAFEPDAVAVAVVAPQVFGVSGPAEQVPRRAPVPEQQVEVAVEVVVAERRRQGVGGMHEVESRALGDVGERPVAVVGEHHRGVALQPREEEIEVPVAVEIGKCGRTVAVVLGGGFSQRHAGLGGDILEYQVA